MPHVQSLFVYPVKSLRGIEVSEAKVERRGFRYDRRFMLVQPDGTFLSQRTLPEMALFELKIQDESVHIWHSNHPADVLTVSLHGPNPNTAEPIRVSVWATRSIPALVVSAAADAWFSARLGQPCRLVFMPDSTHRKVNFYYARHPADEVSFADGYPYLLIGQASLTDLNQRIGNAPPMDMRRFRPNIVVAGSAPFEEDTWHTLRIGQTVLYGVKRCSRCIMITIDPDTAQKSAEPLKTLSRYRQQRHKILFGQNLISEPTASGIIRVGDGVEVLERHPNRSVVF